LGVKNDHTQYWAPIDDPKINVPKNIKIPKELIEIMKGTKKLIQTKFYR